MGARSVADVRRHGPTPAAAGAQASESIDEIADPTGSGPRRPGRAQGAAGAGSAVVCRRTGSAKGLMPSASNMSAG